nr:hypothetical protein [Tanacetum cinerariifolium]
TTTCRVYAFLKRILARQHEYLFAAMTGQMRYMKPLNLFEDLLKFPVVERGRLLGLDVGDKYVGLAVFDFNNKVASPLSMEVHLKMGRFRGYDGWVRTISRWPIDKVVRSVNILGCRENILEIAAGISTIFEVDIDGFDEKPRRLQGTDISDSFKFGMNEESLKDYCKQLEQHRLKGTMQSKIRVYESGRTQQVCNASVTCNA